MSLEQYDRAGFIVDECCWYYDVTREQVVSRDRSGRGRWPICACRLMIAQLINELTDLTQKESAELVHRSRDTVTMRLREFGRAIFLRADKDKIKKRLRELGVV